ncbi:MAG: hypothetical protein Q8N56_03595 [bacterium]|nr:hypothetical protein [bacterium]
MRDSRSSHHNIVPPNRGWEEAKGEPLNDLGADGFLDENQDETEKKAAGTPFNWRKFASVAGLGLSFMLIIGLIWFSSKGAKPTINSELIFGAITGLFIATGMDCRRRRQPWDFYLGVIAFAVNWLAGQDWLANGVAAAFTTAAPNLGITSQTVPIIGAIIAVTLLVLLTFYGGRDLTVAGTFIAINALAQKTFEWGAIGKIIDIPGTTVAITICLVVTGLFYLGDIIKPVSDKFRLKSVILTLGSLVAIFVMANTIFKTLPFWVSGLVGFTLNFVLATDYGKSVEGKKAGSIGDLIKTMDDVVRESQYDSVALTTLIIVLWTTAGLPIYFNHA